MDATLCANMLCVALPAALPALPLLAAASQPHSAQAALGHHKYLTRNGWRMHHHTFMKTTTSKTAHSNRCGKKLMRAHLLALLAEQPAARWRLRHSDLGRRLDPDTSGLSLHAVHYMQSARGHTACVQHAHRPEQRLERSTPQLNIQMYTCKRSEPRDVALALLSTHTPTSSLRQNTD